MRIIICDDNKLEQLHTKERLYNVCLKNHIPISIILCQNINQLIFHIDDINHPIDAIFLEADSKEIDENIINQLMNDYPSFKGEMLFYTRSKDYYMEAFDLHIYNFYLKESVDDERFERIILDLYQKVKENQESYMIFSGRGEKVLIDLKDIHYFECIKRIVIVFYGDHQSFEFYSTINKIEEDLKDKGFMRVHRSYIVNISHISSTKGNIITLKNSDKISIGKTYLPLFKERYQSYLDGSV